MKIAFVGLTIFGLAAGLCAAVLANIWRRQLAPNAMTGSAADVQVLLAGKDMPAGFVVDASSFFTKTVPRKEAPEGSLPNPVQVVGKILCAPVIKGQALTAPCFASEGSGFHVVSALRDGMRAVSIALAYHAGLDGLLYPGSIVDVLVSFKAPAEEGGQTQPMTITLLYAVRVLAVENHTIVSSAQETAPVESGRSGSKRHMVTLAVEPKQAEALQLAQEFGTISLTMRNPMDRTLPKADGVALSELADETFKRLLRARDFASTPRGDVTLADVRPPVPPAPDGKELQEEVTPGMTPTFYEEVTQAPAGPPTFTTTVINGPMDSGQMGRILRVTYRDRGSMEVIGIQRGSDGDDSWPGLDTSDTRGRGSTMRRAGVREGEVSANDERLAGAEGSK